MASILPLFSLVQGTCIVGLTFKSPHVRQLFFLVALSLFVYICLHPQPDADALLRCHVGILGSSTLGMALDLLILEPNPLDKFKPNNQSKPASQLDFLSRLKWAAGLLFNVRGVSWNYAIRGLRYPQNNSRFEFALSQLVWAGIYYLVSDVVGTMTRANPAMRYPPVEGLRDRGFLQQAINVVLFWMTLGLFIMRHHTFCSAVSVALGATEPEEWPPFFGKVQDARSVRSFWGRAWHQGLRRAIQPQAKYFTKHVLDVSHKSLAEYIELYICFFLSGLYHAAGDYVVVGNPHTAVQSIYFFVSQAVVITLEDAAIYIGRIVGIREVPRISVLAWIVWVLAVTAPTWIETVVQGGVLAGFLPIISVIDLLKSTIAHA